MTTKKTTEAKQFIDLETEVLKCPCCGSEPPILALVFKGECETCGEPFPEQQT